MATQKADIFFGLGKEEQNYDTISNHCGVYMMKLPPYHTMDWVECIPAPETPIPLYAEQKARHLTYEQALRYKTLLIGKNKIDFIKNNGEGVIYFDLKDGLYAIQYDETLFKTFRTETEFIRGARADYKDKPSAVVHIPVECLSKVEKITVSVE